jgi:hypothetical protein
MSDDRTLAEIPFAAEPTTQLRQIRIALTTLQPPHEGTAEDGTVATVDPDAEKRKALLQEAVPFEAKQAEWAKRVRAYLADAGCTTAQAILDAGCTGLHLAGLEIPTLRDLRAALGGTGIGLPCYVPPNRFCLVHNTVGGLQDGQAARHTAAYTGITRELTPQEEGHLQLTDKVRHLKGGARMVDAIEALRGHDMPDGIVLEDEAAQALDNTDNEDATDNVVSPDQAPTVNAAAKEPGFADLTHFLEFLELAVRYVRAVPGTEEVDRALDALAAAIPKQPRLLHAIEMLATSAIRQSSECETHDSANDRAHAQTRWDCRFCAAAAVIAGDLDLQYIMAPALEENHATLDDADLVSATEVDSRLAHYDKHGVTAVGLFLKVTAWRRRLAQD